MARTESFDKVAKRLLWGTPFRNAECYRIIQSTGMGEYVKIVNNQVVEFTKEPHNDDPIIKSKYKNSLKKSENEMELRGIVSMDGTPIEYYGSEKGWLKFKSEWGDT